VLQCSEGGNGQGSVPIEDGDKAASGESAVDLGKQLPVDNPFNKYPELDPKLLNPLHAPSGVAAQANTFPGWEGLPFKGRIPDLREEDVRQPIQGLKVHVRVFDLSDDKDLLYYESICQITANGFAHMTENRKYDKDKKNWRVFVRWALLYSFVPDTVPHREYSGV